MEGFAFWVWIVLSTHKPIIEKFGKYPYRDLVMGRISTEEEKV